MAPFARRSLLYVMHFCFAFTSRMWDMGIALLIAHLTHNNLAIVAMSSLLSNIAIFFLMGSIGRLLDRTNRLTAGIVAVSVKILAVSSAYALGIVIADEGNYDGDHLPLLVYALPCLVAVAYLSFSTITQSVEKDWIVVLSDGQSDWLTSTNSVMSQIDLICASLAPAAAGMLFSSFSLAVTAGILLLTSLTTAIGWVTLLRYLYQAYPALAIREERRDSQKSYRYQAIQQEDGDQTSLNNTAEKTNKKQTTLLHTCISYLSLEDFMECSCAWVMISYAFLFCTVLSFGSLMTVYLRFAGMADVTIGFFRGTNALMGLLGASLFPFLSKQLGLWNSSQLAISYQFSFIFLAGLAFLFLQQQANGTIYFATAVLLSRPGLWMFDLGVRQIAQENIPEAIRGKVNGQWRSMTAGFEMISNLLAVTLSSELLIEHHSTILDVK
eukprot:scaffold2338_cov184-Ochromonas_danica.AAC.2